MCPAIGCRWKQARPAQLPRVAAVEPDALAGVDPGLAVERQMVAELRDDDLGDQRLGRQPARHDMLGRMRLHHRPRAAAAGILRAARHQHPQLRRHHVEPLGDVLADLRHLAAAAGAERARGLDHPLDPRQMRRQLAAVAPGRRGAGRLALEGRRRLLLGGVEHALGELDILEREAELVGAQLLGLRAELLAPQVGEDRPPAGAVPPPSPPAPPASAPAAPSGARSPQ